MKDGIFDLVLKELPVDSTDILVKVEVWYNSSGTDWTTAAIREFPSKAEATFRRESAKVESAVKKVGTDMAKAVSLIDGLGKRISKLEKKDERSVSGE